MTYHGQCHSDDVTVHDVSLTLQLLMSPCVFTGLTDSWTDATVAAVRYTGHRQVETIDSPVDGLQTEGVVGAWLQGAGGDDDL